MKKEHQKEEIEDKINRFRYKTIKINLIEIKIEKIKEMLENNITKMNGFVLIYDINNISTFMKLNYIKEMIEKYSKNLKLYGYLLIGNKSDLSNTINETIKEKYVEKFFKKKNVNKLSEKSVKKQKTRNELTIKNKNNERRLLSFDVSLKYDSFEFLEKSFDQFVHDIIIFNFFYKNYFRLKEKTSIDLIHNEKSKLKKTSSLHDEEEQKKETKFSSFSDKLNF
jgi:hypothetical protein